MQGAVMKKLLKAVILSALMVSTVFCQNAGVVWTPVKDSPFSGSKIESIVWGNNRFVALGGNGKIAYSLNGVTWAAVNSPFVANNIVFNNDRFVANDKNGKIAYSSDGVTWAAVKSPFDSKYSGGVVWGKDKFVAWGSNKVNNKNIIKIAYSSDGVTWKELKNIQSIFFSYPYNNYIDRIDWDYGQYIAKMGGSSFSSEDDCYEQTYFGFHGCTDHYNLCSSDGISWQACGEEFSDSYANPAFGNNGIVSYENYNDEGGEEACWLKYSSDGKTWAKVAEDIFCGWECYCVIHSVSWNNNKFTAFARVGGDQYNQYTAYSSDGKKWTSVKNNMPDNFNIFLGNNKFIAHNDRWSDTIPWMAYSPDGITWTTVKNYPFGKSKTAQIVYGNGVFVAISEDGKLAYSK
jgi:roadblock/LC7 domain-containing protein